MMRFAHVICRLRITPLAAVAMLAIVAGTVVEVRAEALSQETISSFSDVDNMSVEDVHDHAKGGRIVLVDIRTPKEWAETGIADVAIPVSMHEAGFLEKLDKATSSDRTKPIALICATGGRSLFVQSLLKTHGYKTVINIPEGMLGSKAGPGWIKSGLPIVRVGD